MIPVYPTNAIDPFFSTDPLSIFISPKKAYNKLDFPLPTSPTMHVNLFGYMLMLISERIMF